MKKNLAESLKESVNKTFLVYSSIFFLIVALSSIVAYAFSADRANKSFARQQLSIASETIRLQLVTTVSSELALVRKMADTTVIKQHFLNPSDPAAKLLAYTEFSLYTEHLNNKMIFWASDADKIFYSTGSEPYLINPDDPVSYWYNLTLYETEKFNFNINYNPDLDQINLWVNVPVFVEEGTGKKPIGLLGIGINLTDFSNYISSNYREFDKNVMLYIFNKYNEITAAVDYDLVQRKVHIDDLLGETGRELVRLAHEPPKDEPPYFTSDNKMYMVSPIPDIEWYLAVYYPMPGLFSLNHDMNIVFFSMLSLIFLLFIVSNIFVARFENSMAQQNLNLIEANRKAEAASQAKSDFLAKMSHEIRTPMNAITGMAELLLRGELSEEARGYAQDIKQAGNNLVSIINDILDFSKIEAGKLEIVPINYLLSSLINDTVNIIRMRLFEKPVRFFTNIDGNIPNSLIGDEVRLRQIFLNLLSNAVKYSEKGHIGFTITADKRDDKQVWLKIVVTDTGRGIKPEDQIKLFDEFVKVDVKNNQGIEGTGLGLAITKRLCIAMGGRINMESEYGKGSIFTAIIPQGIESPAPIAAVENAKNKKVLIYEGRINYAKSICWTLENMGVPYTMAESQHDFAAALYREKWFYIFSGYGLYENIKPLMEQSDDVFFGGKKPPLALMVEWGTEAHIPGVRFVSIPVQSLSIANVLNGKADSKGFIKSSGLIRFTFPRARILVVDDIATNLKVVEGLLAPYSAELDTCLNGLQAIELVKRTEYDVVFMDHMMPEMDGIEATKVIRSLEGERFRTLPIIALTANAVVGMHEMFIQNGFNDFLSKPIDVSKLDEMLDRWIPEDKKEKGVQKTEQSPDANKTSGVRPSSSNRESPSAPLPEIPGVDTVKGVAMTGGTAATYKKVLSMFCKDVAERLPFLNKTPEADTLGAFVTQVHALKSASASIGAQGISSMAAGLEAVGKAGDVAFIRESLPDFVKQLTELAHNIEKTLETKEPEKQKPVDPSFIVSHSSLFQELADALKSKKISDIKRILNALGHMAQDSKLKEILEQISDQVFMTEFDSAVKIVEELLAAKD